MYPNVNLVVHIQYPEFLRQFSNNTEELDYYL